MLNFGRGFAAKWNRPEGSRRSALQRFSTPILITTPRTSSSKYVDGPSLADAVREQGPLSAANVHGIAIGVATALVAIHGAGIIHRDLKPANVLFKLGTPKAIDFGIARATDPTREHTRPDQTIAIADNLATKSRNVRQADPGLSLRVATTAVGLKPDDNTRANLVAAIATGYAGELPAGKDIWGARYRPDGTAVVLVARTRP